MSSKIERARKVGELIRGGVGKPQNIIAAINRDPLLQFSDGSNYEADRKSLQRDIARLSSMGQVFKFDARRGVYAEAENSDPAITLPLSDDEIDVIRQLPDAYRRTPYGDAANSLRDKLARLLPADQRAKARGRPIIRISIPALDEISQHTAAAQAVERAYSQGRDLQLTYRPTGEPTVQDLRVHVTSPLELRDGHIYFAAYVPVEDDERNFRLSRVLPGTTRVLPTKHPPRQRLDPPETLRYWLASHIDPSKRFAEHVAERQPDGSHIITAQITQRERFYAITTFLRYGQYCRVLAPEAIAAEMASIARAMVARYAG